MKFNFSFDVAILLTIMTIILYTTGHTYITSYISFFNIESDVLNLGMQDKVYLGYLHSFTPSLIYILIAYAYFTLFRIIAKELKIENKINTFVRKLLPKRKHSTQIHNLSRQIEEDNRLNMTIFTTFFIIGIYVGSYLFLAKIEKNATSDAASDWNKLVFNQVKLKSDTKEDMYYKIKCGVALCVISDKNKYISLVEPKELLILPTKKDFNQTQKNRN